MDKKKFLLSVTVLALILFLVCFHFIDRWLVIQDKPEKVDVIVCLGGGTGERLQKVIELYNKGYAPIVLLTFPGISDPEFREFATDLRKRFLIYKDIPPGSIVSGFESTSTYSEAKNIRNFMVSKNLQSAIVVSNGHHMRRVSYVFKSVFHEGNDTFNMKLLFVPADEEWPRGPWWRNEESLVFVFNEVFKLGYYWLKY